MRRLVDAVLRDGRTRSEEVSLYGPPRQVLRLRALPFDGGVILEVNDVSEARLIDQIRRDFVANISHELKTPIGALQLLAETFVDENDPVVARRLAQRIREESERLAGIVEDLLELSRLESENERVRERLSLDDVVNEAVTRVRAAAENNGVPVETVEGAGGSVRGDRRQLVSATFNLLENAVTYSDPGSVVRTGVATTEDGGREIWVADEGIGIPEGDLERIFERFYRVDRARSRATGGTGLGLAIVRHVAQNHGARVSVQSRLGEGSRFSLTFPPEAVQRHP